MSPLMLKQLHLIAMSWIYRCLSVVLLWSHLSQIIHFVFAAPPTERFQHDCRINNCDSSNLYTVHCTLLDCHVSLVFVLRTAMEVPSCRSRNSNSVFAYYTNIHSLPQERESIDHHRSGISTILPSAIRKINHNNSPKNNESPKNCLELESLTLIHRICGATIKIRQIV